MNNDSQKNNEGYTSESLTLSGGSPIGRSNSSFDSETKSYTVNSSSVNDDNQKKHKGCMSDILTRSGGSRVGRRNNTLDSETKSYTASYKPNVENLR